MKVTWKEEEEHWPPIEMISRCLSSSAQIATRHLVSRFQIVMVTENEASVGCLPLLLELQPINKNAFLFLLLLCYVVDVGNDHCQLKLKLCLGLTAAVIAFVIVCPVYRELAKRLTVLMFLMVVMVGAIEEPFL